MKAPLVIFRIIALNAEATIRRAADSVFTQTHQNWELHMWDNASTDKTLAIMEEYATSDPRVRVFRNEGNYIFKKGDCFFDYFREYDIESTYTCTLDADDEYTPQFAEEMLDFADKNALDIASCGFKYVHEKTGQVLQTFKMESPLILCGDAFGEKFSLYQFYMRSRCYKLFRLTVTDKVGFSKCFYMLRGGDTCETMEHFRNAKRVGFTPETYYTYYANPESTTHRWFDGRQERAMMLHERTISYLTDKVGRVTPTNHDFLRSVYLNEVASCLSNLLHSQIGLGRILEILAQILCHPLTQEMLDTLPRSHDEFGAKPIWEKILASSLDYIVKNEKRITGPKP